MANRYWVGGTANWDGTAGAKWATTSGGAGGAAVPTAADDVFFDLLSGVVAVSISGTRACRSLNTTGYSGTLGGTSTPVLNIGDASGGALTIGATTTIAGSFGTVNFVSTSNNGGAGWPITTNGKTLASVGFNGVGGKWTQQDALACGGITLTNGEWATGGFSVTSGGTFAYAAGTKTWTPGSSAVSFGNTFGSTAVSAGMTVTANTAVVTLGASTVNLTAVNWNGMSFVSAIAGTVSVTGAGPIVGNFTRTGTAVKTDALSLAGDITVTGTFTVQGNSPTNRLLVHSSVLGTARTITAAVVDLDNVDFTDIAGAGAAAPFTGVSLGDALGNSGITFTAAVNRYVVAAGNWSSTATWAATDFGAPGASVPLPHDNVFLTSALAAGTVNADMPRLGRNIDFTGFLRTFNPNISNPSIYGSLTLSATMTWSANDRITLAARSGGVVTSNGKAMAFGGGHSLTFGTLSDYELADALAITTSGGGTITWSGTFDSNGFAITLSNPIGAGGFVIGATANVTLGASVLTHTGTGTATVMNVAAGATLSAEAATFVIAAASANTRTFAGGGNHFGTLTYTVAASTGALAITGANAFDLVDIGAGRTLTLAALGMQSIAALTLAGTAGSHVVLNSSSPGSAAFVPMGLTPTITFADITDVHAIPFDQHTVATQVAATALTATFAKTPTPGDLLIAIGGGSGATGGAPSMTSLGWTLRAAVASGSPTGAAVWTKTAGVAEPRAVTITPGANQAVNLLIFEASVLNAYDVSATGTNPSPIALGPTAATAQAEEWVLAYAHHRSGFATFDFSGMDEMASFNRGVWATRQVHAVGPQSSTFTYTVTNADVALLAAFTADPISPVSVQDSTLTNSLGWSAVVTVAGAVAAEVDAALGGALHFGVAGGVATEADLAQLGLVVLSLLGARSDELDEAVAGALLLAAFGVGADETDDAAAGVVDAVVAGLRAGELDITLGGAVIPIVLMPGARADEADTAEVGTVDAAVAGSLAAEVDAAILGVVLLELLGARSDELDEAQTGAVGVFVRACMAAAANLVTLMTGSITDCEGNAMADDECWDVGDVARLSVTLTNTATPPVAVAPTTITLTVRRPDGTEITPGVANDGVGEYHYDLPITMAGQWRWRWESTGVAAAASEGAFLVQRQRVSV